MLLMVIDLKMSGQALPLGSQPPNDKDTLLICYNQA